MSIACDAYTISQDDEEEESLLLSPAADGGEGTHTNTLDDDDAATPLWRSWHDGVVVVALVVMVDYRSRVSRATTSFTRRDFKWFYENTLTIGNMQVTLQHV